MKFKAGDEFGRLTYIGPSVPDKQGRSRWICQCECGNIKDFDAYSVKSGGVHSCGCYKKESFAARKKEPIPRKWSPIQINKELKISYKEKYKIGDRFNHLELLDFLGTRPVGKSVKTFWLCKCDCGKIKEFQAGNIINGVATNCGCLRGKGPKRETYKKNRKPFGESGKLILFQIYINNAAKRNHIFDLEFNEFIELTQQKCYYCGILPYQSMSRKNSNGAYIYNGIDRMDNEIGYVTENCVPCCGKCNIAKHKLNTEEFLDMVTRIYNYRNEVMSVKTVDS